MCLKGVAASTIKNLFIFLGLQDYNYHGIFKVWREVHIPHKIVLRGKQENPLSRGIENFTGRIFLLSGWNLTRSDFEHLNLFQS